MKNFLVAIVITAFTCSGFSQNEASYWYFGFNAGLRFNSETGQLTPLTNGRLNTLEGCTSISDSDGNLLFYSDGSTIWNRNHEVMQNGTGLKGDESSTSSGLIVPKPQDPDVYYLFTVDEPHHLNFSGFPDPAIDGDGVNDGLMYSRINIPADGGLGAVDLAEKNVPLITYDPSNFVESSFKCSEKITAVRADDCSSFWVITHFVDKFYAFKVDTNGVSTTPIVSQVGPVVPAEGYRRNALGYMKASPDGTKLVVAHQGFSTVYAQDSPGGVYLFDFNNDTGEVSNSIELYSPANGNSAYGVEFSAENKKVYATIGVGISGQQGSQLIQWDLESTNIPSSQFILSSSNELFSGALQLGIDKRIYRSRVFLNNLFSGTYLSAIQNPELTGFAAGYIDQAVLLDVNGSGQNLGALGLPPFIQSLFNSQIDIIRNGESTTELRLCDGDSYPLVADEIPGAEYTWFRDGLELPDDSFELEVDSPGFYELFIEPNNGECPIEGSAFVGVFDIPVANLATDLRACDIDNDGVVSFDFSNTSAEILGVQDPDQFQVLYYRTENDALNKENNLQLPYISSNPNQRIFARIEHVENDGCFDITSFNLSIFGTPVLNELIYETCDDTGDLSDGISDIDLGQFSSELALIQPGLNINVTYHLNAQDANINANALPETLTNSVPFTETLFVRVENSDNVDCFQVGELQIVVNPAPAVSDISIFQCDEDGIPNGITQFNLNEVADAIANNETDRSIEFYLDQADALAGINALDGTNYTNITPLQVIITKVTNNSTGCENFGELILEVSSTSANDAVLEKCDSDEQEDGFFSFDLTEANDLVLAGLPPGLDIEYYTSYENALLESSPLSNNFTNTTPFEQVIFARVENANACYGINEVELRVLELPDIETEFETIYCLNTFPETISLTGGVINDSPNNYSYEWSTGATTTEIQINAPGTFTVEVFNTLGCSKTRTITVEASNIATVTDINVTDASNNNSIAISVSGEGNYEYALNNPEGPYQDEPFFSGLPPELYTLYVRDKNGCGIREQDVSVIGFPRFFTPNGDGVNDFWQIKGVSSRGQVNGTILVYDRYGKLVANIDPLSPGWNGFYNGNLMPATDYWFSVRLDDGRTFTSNFSLKR